MSPAQPAHASDRRTVRRWTVDCEAKLQLVGSALSGSLTDLSERGARMTTAILPSTGVSGMLSWGDQHHYCTVVWARDGACGLVFERHLSMKIVAAFTTEIEVEMGPIANFGNIPLAQKRSRRFSLVGSD